MAETRDDGQHFGEHVCQTQVPGGASSTRESDRVGPHTCQLDRDALST